MKLTSRLSSSFVMMVMLILHANLRADDTKLPGLAVGENAPDFKLRSQGREEIGLSDLIGKGKSVALVFHRSADW